jgi:hypothetical protein
MNLGLCPHNQETGSACGSLEVTQDKLAVEIGTDAGLK